MALARIDFSKLQNRYLGMRHAQSVANARHLIVSDPDTARSAEYGLTDVGRSQVLIAAHNGLLSDATIIYTSDLARARETATILADALRSQPPIETSALRERGFGEFNLSSDTNYGGIWAADARGERVGQVEMLDDVLSRVIDLLIGLERQYLHRDILLISHGDVLQIIACAFSGQDLAPHASLVQFEPAQIRQLSAMQQHKTE